MFHFGERSGVASLFVVKKMASEFVRAVLTVLQKVQPRTKITPNPLNTVMPVADVEMECCRLSLIRNDVCVSAKLQ